MFRSNYMHIRITCTYNVHVYIIHTKKSYALILISCTQVSPKSLAQSCPSRDFRAVWPRSQNRNQISNRTVQQEREHSLLHVLSLTKNMFLSTKSIGLRASLLSVALLETGLGFILIVGDGGGSGSGSISPSPTLVPAIPFPSSSNPDFVPTSLLRAVDNADVSTCSIRHSTNNNQPVVGSSFVTDRGPNGTM
jgi:hypothetical protein